MKSEFKHIHFYKNVNMISIQHQFLQVPKLKMFNIIKINCKFPSYNLQLKKQSEKLSKNKSENHIPYMSYDDPMHSQK